MTAEWWLIHVHGQREFSLARDLAARGLDYFLPLSTLSVVRLWRQQKIKRRETKPLFPGWLFVNGHESREVAVRSPARISVIPMPAAYEKKLRNELRSLEIAMRSNASLGTGPEFREGNKVRVKAGPLAGVTGYVQAISETKGRLWMNVFLLGAGATLEIDTDLLESA